MSDCPFDDHLIERIIQEDISESEGRILIEHLKSDCPHCDLLFDELKGGFEKSLVWIYLSGNDEVDMPDKLSEGDMDRIFEATRSKLNDAEPPSINVSKLPSKKNKRYLYPLAASIVLMITVFIIGRNFFPFIPDQTIKGPGINHSARISMKFLVETNEGKTGSSKIERGRNNGTYNASDKLLFRFSIDESSWVYIAQYNMNRQGEIIYPAHGLEETKSIPDDYDALFENESVYYDLGNHSGLQTFCAVALSKKITSKGHALQKIREAIFNEENIKALNDVKYNQIDCITIMVE
jgi:hypothetical protein